MCVNTRRGPWQEVCFHNLMEEVSIDWKIVQDVMLRADIVSPLNEWIHVSRKLKIKLDRFERLHRNYMKLLTHSFPMHLFSTP